MSDHSINERAQYLLKVLIERYIQDGQPVGSKTLAAFSDVQLSSATIRNILADLERLGYLCSPHTSAGRVPTSQGYQFFVNSLLTVKPIEESVIETCQQQLNPSQDEQTLLQKTSRLLASVTKLAGVVTLPKPGRITFRCIEFIKLSEKRLLAILVFNEKEIQNRIIHTEKNYTDSELVQIGNYLTKEFCGKNLADMRQGVVQALQQDYASMDNIMRQALQMAGEVMPIDDQQNDYLLLEQRHLWEFRQNDSIDRMSGLLQAFAEKQKVLALLDHCLAAEGVQIYVGAQAGYSLFEGCSLVTAPYSIAGKPVGMLGVIGPTRMAYEYVVPVVDVTAKILTSALN